ncbi:hypothetical protein BROUX41_001068 [Berkeleyomyces rouxiae]|uniref:uncharacterized protein n=1 Tax=Berkeleyomyces rouxiae TaxID=2035830 RepID=UPI003B76CCF3
MTSENEQPLLGVVSLLQNLSIQQQHLIGDIIEPILDFIMDDDGGTSSHRLTALLTGQLVKLESKCQLPKFIDNLPDREDLRRKYQQKGTLPHFACALAMTLNLSVLRKLSIEEVGNLTLHAESMSRLSLWGRAKFVLEPVSKTESETTVMFWWTKDIVRQIENPDSYAVKSNTFSYAYSGLPIMSGDIITLRARCGFQAPSYALLKINYLMQILNFLSNATEVNVDTDELFENSLRDILMVGQSEQKAENNPEGP